MVVCLSLICFLIIILCVLFLKKRTFNYWRIRGVPHIKPLFIFGNYKDYILLRKPIGYVARDICREFPNEPYIGSYYGTDPALIIQDPELIKLILNQEFKYFNGREISNYCQYENFTKSMFFVGGDDWKILRKNLTPLFSSSKMKNMFYLVQNCRQTLEEVLRKETSISPNIDAKSLATRYIMDCIGSCVFGLDINALTTNKTNPFIVIAEEILSTTVIRRSKFIMRSMWPSIFYGLHLQLFPSEIRDFFQRVLTQVFQSRKYKNNPKNDLVDLLMTWEKEIYVSESDSLSEHKKSVVVEVNTDLLVSQCALFFAAGHETSSSTVSFGLYELAKNKDVQTKLIKEIDAYIDKNKGKVEYECINELPYLEACLDETMRLYPIFSVLTRETMHNYTLPTGLHLEKGVRIHIPVYHLHRNPKYFPEPEQFRPERFFGEEKKNVTPFTFLPFGEGPRTCIGLRLAKMQMYPAFITIFKDYEIELMEGMSSQPKYVIGAISTQFDGGIYLKFTKRKK